MSRASDCLTTTNGKYIDEDVIPCLFPDLPKPFDNEEFEQKTSGEETATVRSLEWHTREAKKAKAELTQVQDGI